MNALGPELFNHVYDFLRYHRAKKTDEALMHADIKNMVGGDKRLMNVCFNLDLIVYMELMQQ